MDEESNQRLGEWIVQLANGNCFVLEKIALLLERILIAVGNSYYDHREDVEDAIQNLYVTLYEKAKFFKRNTNAYAWVLRIFENSIKTNLRKRKREDKFLQEEISDLKAATYVLDEKYIDNHLFLRGIFDKLNEEEQKIVIYYHCVSVRSAKWRKYYTNPRALWISNCIN